MKNDPGSVMLNSRDQNGNTALHLAATLGRTDVVMILLAHEAIDDTVMNRDDSQASDMAKTPDLAQQMQGARAEYVKNRRADLERHVAAGNVKGVEEILDGPRAQKLVSLNRSNENGSTPLHEAARRGHDDVVDVLLGKGADPVRRDKNGKLAHDVAKTSAAKQKLKVSATGRANVERQADVGSPSSKLDRPVKMKGYLKKWTNYTKGYRSRWFVLENGVLSYYKNQDDTEDACRGSINMRVGNIKFEKADAQSFTVKGKGNVRYNLKANHKVEANRWIWAITNAIQQAKENIQNASFSDDSASATSSIRPGHHRTQSTDSMRKVMSAADSRFSLDSDEESDMDVPLDGAREPHQNEFETTAYSAKLQLDVLEQLINGLIGEQQLQASVDGAAESSPIISKDEDPLTILRKASLALHNTLNDLVKMTKDRDSYWRGRVDREREIRRLWEENMEAIANEQRQMEKKMNDAIESKRLTKRALRQLSIATNGTPRNITPTQDWVEETAKTAAVTHEQPSGLKSEEIAAILSSESEDEEFFDAPGTVDVEEVHPLKKPDKLNPEIERRRDHIAPSFHGYSDPIRSRLKLDSDDRPKISLWTILKSMIGKDMTKMTLPVSFNECTSLLQRVAEDMEYTDLLDTAATLDESTDRMAYVAAFAASEYASTINRIAKPFNPLLHETYEYVRPDKHFRFVVEQVSHHPPVGAAFAESPFWEYSGESSVQSKFTGKSFDINPLGTWTLKLHVTGKSTESYTWKKVNTAVVGIMLGSPTVDNYGEMVVENKQTGDTCRLEFAARGWTGRRAYEVKGSVTNKQGKAKIDIAGHWNDKLIARRVADDGTTSNPFIIWQANPRPPAPFNLTPFAITLNAPFEELLPYLPPTDTRLRPDQRAMEEGQYDFAAKEKDRLENKQRARRKERERSGENSQGTPRYDIALLCYLLGVR